MLDAKAIYEVSIDAGTIALDRGGMPQQKRLIYGTSSVSAGLVPVGRQLASYNQRRSTRRPSVKATTTSAVCRGRITPCIAS